MDRVNLGFYVIPSNIELENIVKYNPSENGKVISTSNEIKVNKTSTGYSIIYSSNEIKNLDINILGNNIIKLFMNNLSDKIINIKLYYLYEVINQYGDPINQIDISVINSLLTMESKFMKLPKDGSIPFNYIRSADMIKIINETINNYQYLDNEDDDDDEDDDDGYFNNDIGLSNYFESFGISNFTEDDDDEDDDEYNSFSLLDSNIKGKKSNKKYYQSSRIMHNATNAKRSYNRHGVIITNKESKRRDEKIIKEFLKEFFPGNSEWKKNFRHDVLKRWMKMYCVTKKDLKELEKTHRKARNNKRNNINNEKTLDFTRRLFNVPIDKWSDPSR